MTSSRPTPDELILFYDQALSSQRFSEPPNHRVLRALCEALAAGQSPTVRELAEQAEVSSSSVSRILRQLRELGVLRASVDRKVHPGAGSERLQYRFIWPPHNRSGS
jgi:DNA-binding MarR family transcriptional regulator